MLKFSLAKALLPAALLAFATVGAQASAVESFNCGVATVMTIPEEGRAQIDTLRGTFFADAVGGGVYRNDNQELQFYPDENPPTLWMGSEQMSCQVMVADNEGVQTHSGGAVGGNEVTVNAQGQSLGGNLRNGPGTNFSKVASVAEGTWITILVNTGIRFDGYDWFEVTLDNGTRGYHWGGIMCSNGAPLNGTYTVCGQQTSTNTSTSSDGVEVNAQGRSLGGTLRSGPGTNYSRIGSVAEGTWITILKNTGVRFDGYDWFEIALDNGTRGFQWGGIMCSNGAPLNGTYSVCGQETRVNTNTPSPSGGWMAFAVGNNNIFGHGAGNTQAEAQNAALQFCNDNSCQIADVTDAQCHALAQTPGGSWFGAAPTQRAAEDFAAGFCVGAGASSCRIAYSYCQ